MTPGRRPVRLRDVAPTAAYECVEPDEMGTVESGRWLSAAPIVMMKGILMVVFGLILLLLGLGAGAFALWVATAGAQTVAPGGGTAMAIDFLGNTLELSVLTLLLLGVVGVLLALLGLWCMIAATKRKAREAKERRELRKNAKRQEKDLADTRRRLADEDRNAGRTETREVPVVSDSRGDTPRADVYDERSKRPVADGTEYESGSTASRDGRLDGDVR